MWIRFANSHTGQRHYARANRPDRWQHPTTAKTRIHSCIFWGVHRWEADLKVKLSDNLGLCSVSDFNHVMRLPCNGCGRFHEGVE